MDFETANNNDASICAVGAAAFEDGRLVQSRYWLVRPPKGAGFFLPLFTDCHGLTWFDVQDQPEFPAIAPDLLTLLTAADFVVAHYASFDLRKLHGTLRHFNIECPAFECRCTCEAARKAWPQLPNHQLSTVAEHIGHKFHHHHAGEDAEAAGWVMLAAMKEFGQLSKNIRDP